MKHPNPFFHLLEELSLLILITPVAIGVVLYEQGIDGFRLICISLIGSICLWAVFFTLKMLREMPESGVAKKENMIKKEF